MPTINDFLLNTVPVNGPEVFDYRGEGTILAFEQDVTISGIGTLLSFEQTLEFRDTGEGTLLSFEQTVNDSGAGTLLAFEQVVVDPAIVTRVDTAGWAGILTVGARRIPDNEIDGGDDLVILRTEDSSALMTVTIRPASGVLDLTAYQGKAVTYDLIEAGGITRLYTGVVDIPELDIIDKSITLRCTTRREELINSRYANSSDTIGFYSTSIFADPSDIFQEVEQRLETIPSSLDFDAYNKPHLTAWQPKATPSFTLTNSGVYEESLDFESTHRGRIINQVNIEFVYRYDRNYHWQRNFSWESPIEDTPCLLFIDAYSRVTRDKILAAASGTGWVLKDNVSFGSGIADGWYQCGDLTLAWTNVNTQFTTNFQVDELGANVLDENGNPIYESTRTGAIDFTNTFAESATWSGTQRWAQTISETYTVTVKAPQSISQYTTISKDEGHGIESPFDSGVWEDYNAYDNQQPAGDTTYFIDRDTNEDDFNEAYLTVLNRAKTTILSGHRDNKAKFKRGIWAAIDLRHTVALTTTPINTKGKVTNIEHRLNHGTTKDVTTVEISMSTSIGSQSDGALVLPSRPSDTVSLPTSTIRLDNHFGVEPKAEWSGMIGNSTALGGIRSTYAESFTVDTPAVPEEFRNGRDLSGSATLLVEIPNDTLTLTY